MNLIEFYAEQPCYVQDIMPGDMIRVFDRGYIPDGELFSVFEVEDCLSKSVECETCTTNHFSIRVRYKDELFYTCMAQLTNRFYIPIDTRRRDPDYTYSQTYNRKLMSLFK